MPQSVTRKASLAMRLMQCESATDSKVWMGEDIKIYRVSGLFFWPLYAVFSIPKTRCQTDQSLIGPGNSPKFADIADLGLFYYPE